MSAEDLNRERGYDGGLNSFFMDSPSHTGGGSSRPPESHFETLARMAPVGIFVTDVGGRCSYVNPRWCALAGISAEQARGTAWSAALHPEDRERVLREWKQCTSKHEAFRTECRFQRADGSVSWLVAEAVPEHNALGRVLTYVGTVTDLSEVRRVKRDLRENEARIGAILDTAVDGIILIDARGSILSLNKAVTRMFGYGEEELIGKNVNVLMPNPHREEHDDYLRKYLATGRASIIGVGREVEGLKRDGSRFPIELGVSQVDADSPLFAGILRDISRQKAAEADLLESRRTLSTLIGNLSGMVYRCNNDRDCTMKFVSAGSRELTGYEPEDLILNERTSYASLVHPEDREEVWGQVQDAVKMRTPYTLTYRLLDRGGQLKWVWEQGTPVFAGDKLKFLEGWITDISKLKQLEDEFLQAQKLEAVGQLAGGIAHDFNNLLMAIGSGCRIVESLIDHSGENGEAGEETGDKNGEAVRFLGEIRNEIRRGASLTRQLLDFSRKRPRRPTLVRLNESIENTESILKKLLGEDVDLHIVLDETDPLVMADPGQMEQILMNLSVNARDSMPLGGRLEIRLSSLDKGPVAALEEGPCVLLEVADSGCGMDAATKHRIFEPFFTTKEVGKGTGLGLSTVFGLVQGFGGHIEVDSTPGVGTTFRIYFPKHEAVQDRPEPAEEVEHEPLHGEGTVLVIEDEDLVRAGISHLLKGLGYRVLAAGDPDQALELVGQHPEIDLVLSDIVLPGKNGPLVVEEIKELIPDIRVLFMSGFSDDALLDQGRLESRVSIIEKPFEEHELARRIKEALNGGALTGE